MTMDRIKPIIEVRGWRLEDSYQELPSKLYSKVFPHPVKNPEVVIYNTTLGEKLGISIREGETSQGASLFSGNEAPEGAVPIAQAYAGHQFGHFTLLGDGRAITLGEHITPRGDRYDIQLKGSGATPYSRRGDGRAALGPMLREYIISEAMNALGIPSTRALAVVTTGENILREKELPGAILTRVASSHIRVGTFEYIARFGSLEEIKALADYTIWRHFPQLLEESEDQLQSSKDQVSLQSLKYLKLFQEVMRRQAVLIAKWQSVGFIHGVMNTDNMAISGETIDYGPCAFMDAYDPNTVFSSIDRGGRYAYKNQPSIAKWNLARFAETLLPLIDKDQNQGLRLMEKALGDFDEIYREQWLRGMGKKIGISQASIEDRGLIEGLLDIMQKEHLDYTNTFIALTYGTKEALGITFSEELDSWKEKWKKRLSKEGETEEEIKERMKTYNPLVIPRNHQVEKAINGAVDRKDYQGIADLMQVLRQPYGYTKEHEPYQKPPGPREKPYVTYCGT